MKTVSVYSEAGWKRDLASLNQGRSSHACGSYVNGGKKVNQIILYHSYLIDTFNAQFLMVTGGLVWGTKSLDSTEIFSDNVWKTVIAKLPISIHNLSVATVNNRVLAFGKPLLFVID